MFKRLCRKLGINPLDRLLKKAASKNAKKVLVCWNRGLGDIPLGLYALVIRIRHFMPDVQISFLTRKDLESGFHMLEDVGVLVDPDWKRRVPFDTAASLKKLGKDIADYDLVLERPDPTNWLQWQIGKLTPRLKWNAQWDDLWQKFGLVKEGPYIGVHVQTETFYDYEKNWPQKHWDEFFRLAAAEYNANIVLFGFSQEPMFNIPGVIDLRGKTNLFEMLSIIKNRCRYLLVPDSGVLSIAYYIDENFPIRIVSLWADPKQGILRQKVASPNAGLRHCALIGKNKDLSRVPVEAVVKKLFCEGEDVCQKTLF